VDSYSGFRNNWNAQAQRPPTGLAGQTCMVFEAS